ncbi:hypothetical protein [Carboxylicivirga sp. N1Y90]|uniref:hypothetical protein n=1 Tax=Carboxylicivirga fragile TaxID=3417571 RepID=UPI003D33DE11|nr:hypothetical protein [Marinilabiliaceae bacterium N1Y90]
MANLYTLNYNVEMKHVYLSTLIIIFFAACSTKKSNNSEESNLLYSAKGWKPVTDNLGSYYLPNTITIKDSAYEVEFYLKQKEADEIVFIELVCDLGHDLSEHKGLSLTYKCDTALVIKLSQSDFGGEGDKSYAHYQYVVPASDTYVTQQLSFSNFTRPDWTPEYSKGKGLNLNNVDAIYLTPAVVDSIGGKALLGVKELILQQ